MESSRFMLQAPTATAITFALLEARSAHLFRYFLTQMSQRTPGIRRSTGTSCIELGGFVRNYSYRSSRFGWVLLTSAFEKPSAGRADKVEQRHPYKEQGDDGDRNDEGNDFVRHNFLRDLAVEAVDRSGQPQPNGGHRKSHQKFGSESVVRRIIRLGELVIREQGPGMRRAMGCSDNCSMAQVAALVYE
jgi:hypothetical protein